MSQSFDSFRMSLKTHPIKLFHVHLVSMENTGQCGQADLTDVAEFQSLRV